MRKLKTILESKLFLIFIIIITILIASLKYKKEIPSPNNELVIKSINKSKCQIYADNVLISYYADCVFEIGDRIKVYGEFEEPTNNTNFNLFNYRLYLKSKKIYYKMTNPSIVLLNHTNNIFYKIKKCIIDRISKFNHGDYLYTFILGDNSNLDESIKSSYQENGISHLFSVSGMHVSLLSVILLSLLNKIKKTKLNSAIVITFLFLYAFLVSWTPSIMRALSLFIIVLLNKKIQIKIDYLYIYLFLGFIIYNPYLIHNVGFLFSFIITFFLIRYGKKIKSNNYFIKLFYVSLIAFLSSIPILINNYYSINLLTPLINILFVPLVSLIIFPFSLICFFIPSLLNVLNLLLNILESLSLFIDKFSINITLRHVPFYIILFYYLVIILILEGYRKYILILILTIFIHHNFFNISNDIHFINVGQGDSYLIRYKYNNAVLIDTGGNKYYDISKNVVIPYLKSIGIKKISALIISHGDLDHMGSSINLVNNFKVDKVIFNCGPYNELEQELIKVLDKKKIKYYSCIKELNIDDNKLYFLQTKEYDNENDNSNVIYTKLNGYKFMFMGDASTTTEKEILNKYNLSNIDVLKVGHHGSGTSSGKDFINEINPKYSIISVGKNNRYGHPNKEVLNNLENSKIYRTDQNGSIMFKIKNNKLKIETCSP